MASSLLKDTGFVKVKTQWVCRFDGVKDWLGIDEKTGNLFHVHLHYRMISWHPCTMEYTLPWKKAFFESRLLLPNGVYTIDPEWGLIIFLFRTGIEYSNKKIGELFEVLYNMNKGIVTGLDMSHSRDTIMKDMSALLTES